MSTRATTSGRRVRIGLVGADMIAQVMRLPYLRSLQIIMSQA